MLVEGSIPFAYTEHKQDHLYEQTTKHISPMSVMTHRGGTEEAICREYEAYGKTANEIIHFPFTIPRQIDGKTTVIDEITVFYMISDGDGTTTNTDDYINQILLRSNDQARSLITEISHTANIGDDTYSETSSHQIVDTPYEMTNSDHELLVDLVNDTTVTDTRILDIEVKYHAKVHE
jgi:hypothetical protein